MDHVETRSEFDVRVLRPEPFSSMSTVYDKADWRADGALTAAGPVERAFTHISPLLSRLIRRGLHNPDFIRSHRAAAVKPAR